MLIVASKLVSRNVAEDFLYRDAQLLDEWKLDEWLGTFSEGARFEVPTNDWKGWGPGEAGYFVADDWELIQARVQRLKSRQAHAENPHSRTNRMISNVQVFDTDEGDVQILANFFISRYRDGGSFSYVGRYDLLLDFDGTELKQKFRRSVLTNEAMSAGARLSFIL